MKKKFKKLMLIIFIGVFAFSSLNVSAAFTQEPTTNIGYELEEMDVFIFNDKGMTKTQNAEPGEDIKKFKIDDIKANPTEQVITETGGSLIAVKLNVEGGLETLSKKVEEVLEQNKESLSGGTDGNYLVTFSVKYKLQLPEGTSVYDSDYANVFSGDQMLLKEETEANNTVGLDQMIITGIYNTNAGKVDWNIGTQYKYHTEKGEHIFTSRYSRIPIFDKYLIFNNGNKPEEKELNQESYTYQETFGESYKFMMYEFAMDGVDDSIEDSNSNQTTENNNSSTEKDENHSSDNEENDSKDVIPVTPDNNDKNDDNDQLLDGPNTNTNTSSNDENSEDDNLVITPSDNTNTNSTDNTNNTNSDNSANSNNSTNSRTVRVPNTAANSNVNITLFGMLLLISGSGIVLLTKKEM